MRKKNDWEATTLSSLEVGKSSITCRGKRLPGEGDHTDGEVRKPAGGGGGRGLVRKSPLKELGKKRTANKKMGSTVVSETID